MNTATTKAAILEVVRGNLPWESLSDYGIVIRRIRDERRWDFGAYNSEPVPVSEADVVEGIRKNIDDRKRIAEWAQFILAASELINLDQLSDAEGGLLDCLWEIGHGKLDCALRFTRG